MYNPESNFLSQVSKDIRQVRVDIIGWTLLGADEALCLPYGTYKRLERAKQQPTEQILMALIEVVNADCPLQDRLLKSLSELQE